jgi:hypothetical protein
MEAEYRLRQRDKTAAEMEAEQIRRKKTTGVKTSGMKSKNCLKFKKIMLTALDFQKNTSIQHALARHHLL